ncbi:MAG: peptidoglycan recognition family protein [Phycisphaerae bacterium]
MTQRPEGAASAPPPSINWKRMLRVWGILAASMALGALACWAALRAAMPERPPPLPAVGGVPEATDLADLLWPEEMAAARPWRYIVIHHSATPTATVDAIRRYHVGIGFEGVGYHFVINNGRAPGTADGRVTPTQRWLDQRSGAHARIGHHPEYNSAGIGICLVGNFEKEPPTPKQMVALERLVLALCRRYDIGLDAVVGHGELKNTKCPGRLFPMESFLMDVRQAMLRRHLQGTDGGP